MNNRADGIQQRKIILTHVGASTILSDRVLRNKPPVPNFIQALARDNQGLNHENYLDGVQTQLHDHLRRVWQNHNVSYRRRNSPAEIASLDLLGLRAGDRIVLLHSATEDGRLCAKALQFVLGPGRALPEKHFPQCEVEVREIAGLKVGDDEGDLADDHDDLFVREGLKHYIEHIWAEYKNCGNGDALIFNVTGGYKGMIPIARDMSTMLVDHSESSKKSISSKSDRKPITSELCYLYEQSSRLIRYDALPISYEYAWKRVQAIAHLLQKAEGKDGVASNLILDKDYIFFAALPGQPTHQRLSPFGTVIWCLYKHIYGIQEQP